MCTLLLYLVHKIDADLLETVVFENFKPSNIEHSTKVDFLHLRIDECFIALLDEPFEEPVIDCPGDATSCICCLQLCQLCSLSVTLELHIKSQSVLQKSLPAQHFDPLSPTLSLL